MFRSTLRRGFSPTVVAVAATVATLTACAGGQADKADPVGSTTATLNGYWKSTGTPDFVRVYFKYGTTTAYGTRVAARVEDGNCWVGYYPDFSACFNPGPANTVHKYSVPVAGLAPNTTYHFSLCANDEDPDRDICLNDKTFKTQS